MLFLQDVVESFQITQPIIPTRSPSKKPTAASSARSTAGQLPQMNGVASSAERARASSSFASQASNSSGRSSRAASSTALKPAVAGPSGVTRMVNGSPKSHASSSPRRTASRRTYVFDESDDDDRDTCKVFLFLESNITNQSN